MGTGDFEYDADYTTLKDEVMLQSHLLAQYRIQAHRDYRTIAVQRIVILWLFAMLALLGLFVMGVFDG